MQTEIAFSEAKSNEIQSFIQALRPSDKFECLYLCWLLNSKARYEFAVLKNYQLSAETLQKTVELSRTLWSFQFEEHDSEVKSLILILALNCARLSSYAGKTELGLKQFKGLQDYLKSFSELALQDFPGWIKSELVQRQHELAAIFNSDIRNFLDRKIESSLSKITRVAVETREPSPRPLKAMNFVQLIQRHALTNGNQTAFFDFDSKMSLSWKTLDETSDQLAAYLRPLLKEDLQFVVVCCHQDLIFPKTLVALWKLRCIPILIHEDFTEFEFAYVKELLDRQDPVVMVHGSFSDSVKKKFESFSKNFMLIEDHKISERLDAKTYQHLYSDLPALGLFTSGSTEKPKLIVFSHKDLFHAAHIECENDDHFDRGSIVNLRPPFTSGGLNTYWPALLKGNPHILSEKIRKTPIARFLSDLIRDTGPRLVVLSPSYIQALIPSIGEMEPLSSRQVDLYFGGMALPDRTLQELLRLNFRTFMRYGMTEVGHIVSRRDVSARDDSVEPFNVGKPYSGCEVGLMEGRLTLKSPGLASFQLMKGHLVPLGRDGLYASDDRAHFNSSGEILLEGRENSTLAVRGFRFHAHQVERVILQLDSITRCHVLGVADSKSGQVPIAFCQIQPHSKQEEIEKDLRRICEKCLSPFKHPKVFVFLEDWPSQMNGKLDLKELYALAEEAYQKLVHPREGES